MQLIIYRTLKGFSLSIVVLPVFGCEQQLY